MQNRVLSLLSIAMKAGAVVSGEFMVEKAVKERKAHLVLTATDASENTKKKFLNMCTYYNIPIYVISNKEELGRVIGREIRATAAVLDKGLKNAIIKELEDNNGGIKYGEN